MSQVLDIWLGRQGLENQPGPKPPSSCRRNRWGGRQPEQLNWKPLRFRKIFAFESAFKKKICRLTDFARWTNNDVSIILSDKLHHVAKALVRLAFRKFHLEAGNQPLTNSYFSALLLDSSVLMSNCRKRNQFRFWTPTKTEMYVHKPPSSPPPQ